MLVISDGDVAANFVRDPENEEWMPLGLNRFEGYTYANKELMLNAIEYMMDADGVIEARAKEVKLRLLDTVRAKEEKTGWQVFNIGDPDLTTPVVVTGVDSNDPDIHITTRYLLVDGERSVYQRLVPAQDGSPARTDQVAGWRRYWRAASLPTSCWMVALG